MDVHLIFKYRNDDDDGVCYDETQTAVFRELLNVRYVEACERKVPWFRSIHYFFYLVGVLYVQGGVIRDVLRWLLPHQSTYLLDYTPFISTILYAILLMWFVLSLKKGMYRYQFGNYIYIYMCMCLYMCVYVYILFILSLSLYHSLSHIYLLYLLYELSSSS